MYKTRNLFFSLYLWKAPPNKLAESWFLNLFYIGCLVTSVITSQLNFWTYFSLKLSCLELLFTFFISLNIMFNCKCFCFTYWTTTSLTRLKPPWVQSASPFSLYEAEYLENGACFVGYLLNLSCLFLFSFTPLYFLMVETFPITYLLQPRDGETLCVMLRPEYPFPVIFIINSLSEQYESMYFI